MRMFSQLFIVFSTCALWLTPALAGPNKTGAKLDAEKTANPIYEHTIEYDWDIEKTADPTSVTLAKGQSTEIKYTFTTTRVIAKEGTVKKVEGDICVTNNGNRRTQKLKIVDTLQVRNGSEWENIPGIKLEITPTEQIEPGESECYPYSIISTSFEPGLEYRNQARITITNFKNHLGQTHGITVFEDFTFPEEPTETTKDAEAAFADDMVCPSGFTCSAPDSVPTEIEPNDTFDYKRTITNDSIECGFNVDVKNIATLIEGDSGDEHSDDALVDVFTGECEENPGANCTRTPGYWKNHEDVLAIYLPQLLGTSGGAETVNVTTVSTALEIFDQTFDGGAASNGITRLYNHMLAAKLNIAKGADGSTIAATITAADAFLATHDTSDWASLTAAEQTLVNSWKDTFDAYNNGTLPGGPAHCE